MKVQDLMTGSVKSCSPDANLAVAGGLMWENDCGVLAVTDKEGKVVGMITDRDIAIAAATRNQLSSEISVAEVVSGQVYSCALDDDVESALVTLRGNKVRRLPVVDREGVLQGILSMNDITIEARESKAAGGKAELSYADVVNTYKAICEHQGCALAASA
jgi:CBS domain-containing protein